jgi:hypothetical protein
VKRIAFLRADVDGPAPVLLGRVWEGLGRRRGGSPSSGVTAISKTSPSIPVSRRRVRFGHDVPFVEALEASMVPFRDGAAVEPPVTNPA